MNQAISVEEIAAPAEVATGTTRPDVTSGRVGDTLHVVYGLADGEKRAVSLSMLRVAVLALVLAIMSLWTVLSLAWLSASSFNRLWYGEPESYEVPVLIVPLERVSLSLAVKNQHV